MFRYAIGIDTGTHTGIAVWDIVEQKFTEIRSVQLHLALLKVFESRSEITIVRVEDPRQRKWYGNAGKEVLQGVGSVKRDAVIWEEFLKYWSIPFEMVAPKNNITKLTAERFKFYSGWEYRTNEHMRDAAMLVLGYKQPPKQPLCKVLGKK